MWKTVLFSVTQCWWNARAMWKTVLFYVTQCCCLYLLVKYYSSCFNALAIDQKLFFIFNNVVACTFWFNFVFYVYKFGCLCLMNKYKKYNLFTFYTVVAWIIWLNFIFLGKILNTESLILRSIAVSHMRKNLANP
jgi:hypothetical protein